MCSRQTAADTTAQVSLHYILSFSNDTYGRATSLSNIKDQFRGHQDPPYKGGVQDEYIHPPSKGTTNIERKANATFVVLARNGDLQGVIMSMKQMEDRFNKEFNYPWTFLNDEPFTDEFKRYAVSTRGFVCPSVTLPLFLQTDNRGDRCTDFLWTHPERPLAPTRLD